MNNQKLHTISHEVSHEAWGWTDLGIVTEASLFGGSPFSSQGEHAEAPPALSGVGIPESWYSFQQSDPLYSPWRPSLCFYSDYYCKFSGPK